MMLSPKLRNWRSADGARAGVTYWCQGCSQGHQIATEGRGAWGWNGDVLRPVFTPSVLTQGHRLLRGEDGRWTGGYVLDAAGNPVEERCHTFVGCNGAQPGEVIFLGDCTHSLVGTVQPLPELPSWMRDE